MVAFDVSIELLKDADEAFVNMLVEEIARQVRVALQEKIDDHAS